MSVITAVLQLDDQAYQVLGDLSYLLSEIRKELRNWETKWRHVIMNRKPKSSTFIRFQECELSGLVHEHFIIFDSGCVQLM